MSGVKALAGLRQIALGELFGRDVGAWPVQIKVLAGVLLMLLVLLLGYGLHIRERMVLLEGKQAEEVALKQQYTHQAARAADLKAYTVQLADMQASFTVLLKQLPSDAEVPGLLEDISRIGLGNNLAFEEIKLLPEEAQAFYSVLPIQITLVGDYHGFAAFVSDMARLSRIITLHDFQIKPDTSPGLLRMTLLARTYRYGEQGVVP